MSNSRTLLRDSPGRTLIVDSVKQSTLAVLCALSLTLFLSACGPAGSSSSASVTPQPPRSSNPETGAAIAGISAPPGSSDRPLAPGQNGTQYLPNGLPAFQPARGINAEMLFAEKITDSDERFRRLENAVMDLRREFDSVSPAIVRLAAVEGDMQDLIGQLQTLVNNGPSDVNMDLDTAPVAGVTADSLPPRPFPEAPPQATPETPEQPYSTYTQEYQEPAPAPAAVEPAPEAPEEKPAPAATPITPEAELEKQAANNALPQPAPPASGDPAPLQPKAAEGRALPPPTFTPTAPEPEPAPAPVAPAPAPAPAPVAAAPQPGKTTVTSVRTGEQPGGVIRIVLDLTGPSKHHSDLDNEEHLLLIEMPEAGWSAAPKGTFANAPLLTSWTTEPINDGKGTRLILQLSKSVKITGEQSLGDPDRIVLDLKASP